MNSVGEFLAACLLGITVLNPIFSAVTGVDSLLDSLAKPRHTTVLCSMVAVFSILGCAALSPIDLLIINDSFSMIRHCIIYSLVIFVLYFIFVKSVKAASADFFDKYGSMIAPAAFNSAAVGIPLVASYYTANSLTEAHFLSSLGIGVGAALGFAAAAFFIRQGLRFTNNPDLSPSMRGAPILLIYIGILSLAMYAFGAKIPLIP